MADKRVSDGTEGNLLRLAVDINNYIKDTNFTTLKEDFEKGQINIKKQMKKTDQKIKKEKEKEGDSDSSGSSDSSDSASAGKNPALTINEEIGKLLRDAKQRKRILSSDAARRKEKQSQDNKREEIPILKNS